MKKHKSTGQNEIRAEILEEMLSTLPHKELPAHVEERIMDSVRKLKPYRIGHRSNALNGLQWAALTLGACVFMSLGALMTWTVTRQDESILRATDGARNSYDPSLIDYLDVFGG